MLDHLDRNKVADALGLGDLLHDNTHDLAVTDSRPAAASGVDGSIDLYGHKDLFGVDIACMLHSRDHTGADTQTRATSRKTIDRHLLLYLGQAIELQRGDTHKKVLVRNTQKCQIRLMGDKLHLRLIALGLTVTLHLYKGLIGHDMGIAQDAMTIDDSTRGVGTPGITVPGCRIVGDLGDRKDLDDRFFDLAVNGKKRTP